MQLLNLATTTILCICAVQNAFSAAIEPIVETGQGKLKGKLGESRNGRKFVQYLGIPYAQKPLRFQEAGPPEKWEGVRDATKFGSPCVQFDRKTKGVVGSEDCLSLNIFSSSTPPTSKTVSISSTTTPKSAKPVVTSSSSTTTASPALFKSSGRKLPVLVYIHGGSFVSQSGHLFGAKYFLDEDVVLVTLNYRLGVLGFLSTGDSESIANLGLRDQILALKWIKENIVHFEGDPARITLVGGSAGGAMTSYLMLAPPAKYLFSGVISQSGNALCSWVIVRSPQKVAHKLATKLNCPAKSSNEIMTCIKGKSLKDIEIARVALQGFAEDPAVPFAPVVEKWVTQKDKAVVPELPQKLLAQGKAGNIPWMTGYNSLNGLNLAVANILTNPKHLTKLDQEWAKLAPLIFHYSQSAPNPQNVSAQVRQYYFGDGKLSDANKEKLVIALTDRNFISCTAQAALTQAKFGSVYLYTLNHQGTNSFLDEWGVRDKLKMRGVVHNDELPLLFNIGLQSLNELKKGDKDTPFSEKMVKIWTEFAKTGKPMEQVGKTEFQWAPVLPSQSSSSLRWYQLDSTSQSRAAVIESPTFKVWESVDLGEETMLPKDNGKIMVGYTMTEKPKPLTISSQKSPPGATIIQHGPGPKPASGSSGGGSSLLPYGLSPSSSTSSPPPTQSSSLTTKSSSTAPPPIHAVFKDEDPYSSTTTTTTKKPGFFSKILG